MAFLSSFQKMGETGGLLSKTASAVDLVRRLTSFGPLSPISAVTAFPKQTRKFALDLLQEANRSVGSVGVSVGKRLGGVDELSTSSFRSPAGQKVFRTIFGDKPLKALEDRIATNELSIQRSPTAKELGLDKYALPLAFGGVIGDATLSVTPLAPEKNLAKQLLKERNVSKIISLLQKSGVPGDIARTFSTVFSKANTPELVQDGLNILKSTLGVQRLSDTPLAKLTSAIKESAPLRSEIETLQSVERAKRFSKASEAQSMVGGQQGYFSGLSKLKGELLEKPPSFTPLKDSLDQTKVDELFSMAQNNPRISFTDKLAVQRGLTKLLDGHVPVPSELKYMEEVFGSDVIRAIYDKRPLSQKIWEGIGEIVADIPRAIKTTLDMSATLRQSIVLGTRHPIRFTQAFGDSFKQMISNNTFEKALDTMKSTPEYRIADEAGLAISDPRKLFGGREEYFLSNLAEKIPFVGQIVKASNRAYVGMANSLRFSVFNDLAQSLGETNQASRQNLEALADFVNTATGRGSLGSLEKHSELLSKIFFAPRFVMSRLQFFNPIWYAKQPTPIRKEAIKTFASFVGTVSTIITLAKMGGADVETDWRSSDFGKLRRGDTRYDLTAGFGLYIRLFGQLVTGEKKTAGGEVKELGGEGPYDDSRFDVLGRVVRGKLAPAWSAMLNLLAGENVVGEEATIKTELIDQVTPLYVKDLYEALQERGPEALLDVGLPAFFGVGVQTYKDTNAGSTKKFLNSF